MKEPMCVADCVAAMAEAVRVPVTVKCRLGVDEIEDYDVFRAFIDTVAAAGCDLFVVHARKAWLSGLSPKENREIPPLRYEWVWRLKQERPDLRIVLNGGLTDAAAALVHLPATDGVMLGRAAYHEPYRLHELHAELFGGPTHSRETLLRRWLPYVESQLARGVALKHMTRHVLGLFHGQPGGRAYRQVLSERAPRDGAGLEVIEAALAMTRSRELAA
jgi:tRNA-dihydrouridine synthase A